MRVALTFTDPAACHDICCWPPPKPGAHLALNVGGATLEVRFLLQVVRCRHSRTGLSCSADSLVVYRLHACSPPQVEIPYARDQRLMRCPSLNSLVGDGETSSSSSFFLPARPPPAKAHSLRTDLHLAKHIAAVPATPQHTPRPSSRNDHRRHRCSRHGCAGPGGHGASRAGRGCSCDPARAGRAPDIGSAAGAEAGPVALGAYPLRRTRRGVRTHTFVLLRRRAGTHQVTE
jgi:hypothetical protein